MVWPRNNEEKVKTGVLAVRIPDRRLCQQNAVVAHDCPKELMKKEILDGGDQIATTLALFGCFSVSLA
jgi:hypothetical protein